MAKKLLILALGVVLAMSFVMPVMAETKVEFSGHYRARYFYDYNLNLSGHEDNTSQSNTFDQRFRIEPKFIVSDALNFQMRINAINSRWGANSATYAYTGAFANDSFDVERAFMEITTSFGRFRIGRMSTGASGLSALGYSGGRFAAKVGYLENLPFDSEGPAQRIMYLGAFGDFNMAIVYSKLTENDQNNAGSQANAVGAPAAFYGYDDDRDDLAMVFGYKWGFGAANVTLYYQRNRAGGSEVGGTVPAWAVYGLVAPGYDSDIYFIQPAARFFLGPVNINTEVRYQWANFKYNRFMRGVNNPLVTGVDDFNADGWGIYLDAIYDFGPGEVGMMFVWTSPIDLGPSRTGFVGPWGDQRRTGIVTTGADFTPFFVAYSQGTNSWLNGQALSGNINPNAGVLNSNNHWLLGAWVDYSITDALMLHGALGYMQLNSVHAPEYQNIGGVMVQRADWKKDYGWEVDFGLTYDIMEGLRYTTIFGYFFAGNAAKMGAVSPVAYGNRATVSADIGNAWSWMNEIRIDF